MRQPHILLLGGGHTHALLLKQWIKYGLPEAKVTLVSEHPYSWYSGAIHAVIHGEILAEQAQVPVKALCDRLGISFIEGHVETVDSLDPQTDTVQVVLSDGQCLRGNVVSINTGSTVSLDSLGDGISTAAVRPLASLLAWVPQVTKALDTESSSPIAVTIIGGGVSAIELSCVLLARAKQCSGADNLVITLLEGRRGLGVELPENARRRLRAHLLQQGVIIIQGRAVDISAKQLLTDTDTVIRHDFCLWAATKRASIRDIAVPVDSLGYVLTLKTLQSIGCAQIFAVGDAGSHQERPHAKNGVFAVRQASILRHNISALVNGNVLRKFVPQTRYLLLLALDSRTAMAVRGGWFSVGRVWYRLKRWIDQRFIDGFK